MRLETFARRNQIEGAAMNPLEVLAAEVREIHLETGRDIQEILEAMRDEGYIECTDEELEQCAARAAR